MTKVLPIGCCTHWKSSDISLSCCASEDVQGWVIIGILALFYFFTKKSTPCSDCYHGEPSNPQNFGFWRSDPLRGNRLPSWCRFRTICRCREALGSQSVMKFWEFCSDGVSSFSWTFALASGLISACQLLEGHLASRPFMRLFRWTPGRGDPLSCVSQTKGESEISHTAGSSLGVTSSAENSFLCLGCASRDTRVRHRRWVTLLAAAMVPAARQKRLQRTVEISGELVRSVAWYLRSTSNLELQQSGPVGYREYAVTKAVYAQKWTSGMSCNDL